MKKLLFGFTLLLLAVLVSAWAVAAPTDTTALYPKSADPCQNPSAAKSSAVVSVGTNTTVQVVALTAGKAIYVCGLSSSLTGTTGNPTTFKLVSGTTTTSACDTGVATHTGTFTNTGAAMTTVISHHGTLFKTAAGAQLCTVTTGTGSGVQGILTYVKQ